MKRRKVSVYKICINPWILAKSILLNLANPGYGLGTREIVKEGVDNN